MKFEDIKVGNYFIIDGIRYRKNSNCTARSCKAKVVKYFEPESIIPVIEVPNA